MVKVYYLNLKMLEKESFLYQLLYFIMKVRLNLFLCAQDVSLQMIEGYTNLME